MVRVSVGKGSEMRFAYVTRQNTRIIYQSFRNEFYNLEKCSTIQERIALLLGGGFITKWNDEHIFSLVFGVYGFVGI